jgi:tetratricopeptide (TPR) repeat protein
MWSRLLSNASVRGAVLAALLAGTACQSAPAAKNDTAAGRAPPAHADAPAAPAASADPSPRALADFDRAVGLMRGGNQAQAEQEFQALATSYPAFAGPDINLGILYRKEGQLEKSEAALKAATTANATSAAAWNELGVTLRLRGEFPAAATAYEQAIAADPNFAPPHRNLGVVLDLYLADPERALVEFERYKELSGEEKPVSVWIAELRQRTGQKKPASPAAAPATPPTPSGE